MTANAWTAFRAAAAHYRSIVDGTAAALPALAGLVQRLVDERDGPSYIVDTPVVYNLALDEFGPDSEIKMILAADNPGRREQAAENCRYLVGPSGKIAENFFRSHPDLGIDFRANVLILNKTPVHTPRTAELRELCRLGGEELSAVLSESQRSMAELLAEFWKALQGKAGALPIWIIGYSEMKKGGVFDAYTTKLKELCAADPAFLESIFFYRHFSMNQFAADLKQQALPGESTAKSLTRIGTGYRVRVLG
jgi:hypothetical protein